LVLTDDRRRGTGFPRRRVFYRGSAVAVLPGSGHHRRMTNSTSEAWFRQLHYQILVAMVIGTAAGLIGGETAAHWLGWMGMIFVRLLRMVIVPLIMTSIVSGVSAVGGGRALGRLGARTFGWYVSTSLFAILTGLILVNLIQPGVGAELGGAVRAQLPEIQTPSSLGEIFVRLIPLNPIQAMASGDMLATIFFALLVGISITSLPEERSRRLRGWFEDLFEMMMVLTGGVIRLAPLGVLGLMTRAVAVSGVSAFGALGLYALTIISGLFVHIFITLPLLIRFVGGMNPVTHYRNMGEALLMAFSTSSSSATLPITIRCVESKVGASNRVASFVLPMGATVNMDGTALYECVGVIFISQVLGIDLSFMAQATIVVTALLASIGAAGIPSAGLVMIFVVTESVGLTGPEVGLIVGTMLAIDRPLDMLRTVTNVLSDASGAAVIARREGEAAVNAEVH
jgi:proton glutamate symport protein